MRCKFLNTWSVALWMFAVAVAGTPGDVSAQGLTDAEARSQANNPLAAFKTLNFQDQ